MADNRRPLSEIFAKPSPEVNRRSLEEIFGAGKPRDTAFQSADATSTGRTILDEGLQGATFGSSDEITDAIGAVGAAIYDKTIGDNLSEGKGFLDTVGEFYDDGREQSQSRLNRQIKERPALSIGSNIAGALLIGGAATGTKAGSSLANSLRSGSALARIGKGGLAGSASAGAYGFGSGSGGTEERAESALKAVPYGLVPGAGIPAAGAAARSVGRSVIPVVDDAIKPLAKRARELGVPLRVDQVAPGRVRNTVQKVSQELPFSGADAFEDVQRKAWNMALAKTIGQNASDLSPATIQNFLDDASTKFGVLTKGKTITVPKSAMNRLDAIVNEAADNVSQDAANIVGRNIQKVRENLISGTLEGSKLASVRSDLVKRLPRIDSGARPYVAEIVDAIDEIASGSLTAAEKGILKQARKEWRNYKTLEPLLEGATDGMINPTQLLARVKGSKYIKASRLATGQDDLVDLARIGKQFMPKKGGSDTFQKTAIGVGAPLGIATIDPVTATATAGGMGANRAFQRGYNSSQRVVDAALNRGASAAASSPRATLPAAQVGAALGGAEAKTGVTVGPARRVPLSNMPSHPLPTKAPGPQSSNKSDLLDRIAMAESGGNPNARASTSSASGLFQFTNSTWRAMVRKYGREYGIKFSDKASPDAQRVMAELLAQENSAVLSKALGREPTGGEIYLAHFAGAGGAKKLLTANPSTPAARILPDAAKANRSIFYDGKRLRSVSEVVNIITSKVT